jgi:ubiquitin-conjugating enzyme E2 variant
MKTDSAEERMELPRHDVTSRWVRAGEAAAIAAAIALLAANLVRLGRAANALATLGWWLPLAILLGAFAADLGSGLVHWFADTWGSETMPILGRRLLRPFRLHHVNPDDFLERSFLDCNGDVAAIVAPILLGSLWIPLDTPLGRAAAVFTVTLCAVGLPTNQVHQWAHRARPPLPVLWLQRSGLLLSHEQHRLHHAAPFAMNYCIATGWCNRVLTACDFFRRAEHLISRITGATPRAEDAAFAAQYDATGPAAR